jgi:hypothetical protein
MNLTEVPSVLATAETTLSIGRLAGGAGAVLALAGVIIGGLSLTRSASRLGRGNGKRSATLTVGLGLTGMVTGGFVVLMAKGGPGTGYGIVGGVVAAVLGLIAAVLGGLVLARSRRRR